jgi:hypothetical protein
MDPGAFKLMCGKLRGLYKLVPLAAHPAYPSA